MAGPADPPAGSDRLWTIKLHTARVTCGTHLYEATLDLKKVQKWLGHSTAAATAGIYVRDRAETDAAAARQVVAYLAQ
jgi:integrase